ncbi:hypothetical protein ACN8ZM_40015 (plasmid) [Burkholderia aenigmatica]|uniref:hypothetical protein n=1 Tax=Burkholderia aenigmatica TaxID=2015348 RepID=UPI003B430E77
MAKKNTVTRRIIDLVIENPEMTSGEIAAQLYGRDLEPRSAEVKRVRVALNTLCKFQWLRRCVIDGRGRYRFNRRHPPKKDAVIHRQPVSPSPAVGRLASTMALWGQSRVSRTHTETIETIE